MTERCGEPLGGNEFGDVVNDPIGTISEMADTIKRLREENAELKQKLDMKVASVDEVDSVQTSVRTRYAVSLGNNHNFFTASKLPIQQELVNSPGSPALGA